jgi:hypothetical protein
VDEITFLVFLKHEDARPLLIVRIIFYNVRVCNTVKYILNQNVVIGELTS